MTTRRSCQRPLRQPEPSFRHPQATLVETERRLAAVLEHDNVVVSRVALLLNYHASSGPSLPTARWLRDGKPPPGSDAG